MPRSKGLSTEQVGLFMGSCIFAGLLVQWPLGWLSDRYDRALLIRSFAFSLAVAALPLAIMPQVPLEVLFIAGFFCSLVQFCLYPLAVAFSNDHVEGDRRVSLTAMLLVTYGVGASIGPLVGGVLMKLFGSHMLYVFFSFFALVLVWRIRPKAVTNLHQVDDAPLHHVAMPDSMSSSPLVERLTRGWTSRWFRIRCTARPSGSGAGTGRGTARRTDATGGPGRGS